MRDSLYDAIFDGDCKKITALIKEGRNVNGVNHLGESPLYFLFGSSVEPNIKQYEAAITLLEAGANPLKKEPDIFFKNNSSLLMSISTHHLAKILWLSWYIEGDYFNICFRFILSKSSATPEGSLLTLGKYLKIQHEAEERDGNSRKYLDHIKLVIADAAAVRSLEARAKAQKSLADTTADPATYIAAAEIYKQIAQIYQKHHDLENSRNYTVFYPELSTFDDSATPEQLHDLFKKYYQQKKQFYLEREFECHQLTERRLAPVDEEGIM